MKKNTFLVFVIALFTYACNSSDQLTTEQKDSIREAEVADSMLNLAVMADSLMQDSLRKDSIK